VGLNLHSLSGDLVVDATPTSPPCRGTVQISRSALFRFGERQQRQMTSFVFKSSSKLVRLGSPIAA
jgi:hypothetical protein